MVCERPWLRASRKQRLILQPGPGRRRLELALSGAFNSWCLWFCSISQSGLPFIHAITVRNNSIHLLSPSDGHFVGPGTPSVSSGGHSVDKRQDERHPGPAFRLLPLLTLDKFPKWSVPFQSWLNK